MTSTTVMLVDDHALIRKGLRTLINSQPDMTVIAEAETGMQALELAGQHKPDVIIMDISLPDFNGLEITGQIKRLSEDLGFDTKVIVLSMYIRESFIERALMVEASGYVSKSASSQEIVTAIRYVQTGKHYLSPEISAAIVPDYLRSKTQAASPQPYDLLTQREQEIFRLLIEGHTNQAIAELLSISVKTVQRHRANLMAKLEVHSFRELLQYAVRIGLLEAEDEPDDL